MSYIKSRFYLHSLHAHLCALTQISCHNGGAEDVVNCTLVGSMRDYSRQAVTTRFPFQNQILDIDRVNAVCEEFGVALVYCAVVLAVSGAESPRGAHDESPPALAVQVDARRMSDDLVLAHSALFPIPG